MLKSLHLKQLLVQKADLGLVLLSVQIPAQAGTTTLGLTALVAAGLSADSGAGPGILGREVARLGVLSAFSLGGMVGDLGLLSEPLIDFKVGQYAFSLCAMDCGLPLSTDGGDCCICSPVKGSGVASAIPFSESDLPGVVSLDTAGEAGTS